MINYFNLFVLKDTLIRYTINFLFKKIMIYLIDIQIKLQNIFFTFFDYILNSYKYIQIN